MTPHEFEQLTGIYPDVCMWSVINTKYMDKEFGTKAQFCEAYKFNEYGLATSLQAAANQCLIDMEEQHRRDMNTAQCREDRLREENAKLTAHIAELEHKCQDFTTLETAQPTGDTERFDHVMEENKRLHEEIEMLRSDKETQCRTLAEMQEIVQMFRVLEDYVRDDVGVQDIGRAVVAFVDLLDRKAVERNV